ncbi:MAG: tetratricopeptide repeat protein [Deltaproteobacteria bacterium]|nr:tetratricopeptide repeat protein [Deltaproteobacteria bacterium]
MRRDTDDQGRAALRLLVVDGSAPRGDLMAANLRAEGLEASAVETVQGAWDALEWSPADVLLLRVAADVEEAVALVPRLARRSIRLVTVSAEPLPDEARRLAVAGGVADTLSAPFDAREMAARLEAAVHGPPDEAHEEARTRAEARPGALAAEELAAAEEPGVTEEPPTRAESGPPAAWVAEAAARAAEAASAAPVEVASAAPVEASSPAPAKATSAAPVDVFEEGGYGGSDIDLVPMGPAPGAASSRAPQPPGAAGDTFDGAGAPDSGMLSWFADDDAMPGTIRAGGWSAEDQRRASEELERFMTSGGGAVLGALGARPAALAAVAGKREDGGGPGTSGGERGEAAPGTDGLGLRPPAAGDDDVLAFRTEAADEEWDEAAEPSEAAEDAEAEHAEAAPEAANEPAAPAMDEEPADLEVGPGTRTATREVIAAALGHTRRRLLVWRAATAMLVTIFVGLLGITGWRMFAQGPGTSPNDGLAQADGSPGAGAGEAAGGRNLRVPEPTSPAESDALLFGEAVESLEAGRTLEANDRFRLLLRSDPEHTRAMAGLAAGLGQLGEYQAAASMLEALVERAPAEPTAWLTRGLVAHQLGDTEGARRGFESFLEAAPDDPRSEPVRRLLTSLDAG